MHLGFEAYQALGGTLPEVDFSPREAWAEAQLNAWTLNRLKRVDWSEWEAEVHQVMMRLVDGYDSIMEAEGQPAVSSFSNGQDSYSFAVSEPLMNPALHSVYGFCVDVLPVELMSACARYNGAS